MKLYIYQKTILKFMMYKWKELKEKESSTIIVGYFNTLFSIIYKAMFYDKKINKYKEYLSKLSINLS
jgi:hypothetical protein